MPETSPTVAMIAPSGAEFLPLAEGLRLRRFTVVEAPAAPPADADVVLACFSPLDRGDYGRLSPWLGAAPVVVALKTQPSEAVELDLLRHGVQEVVSVGDPLACDPVCMALLRSLQRHRFQQSRQVRPEVEVQAQGVVDMFPMAVLIADAQGVVRLGNAQGRALLARRDALFVDPLGRVRLADRTQDARLYHTIRAVQEGRDVDCALAAPRREDGVPLSVLVVPVGSGTGGAARGVTLFVSDPDAPPAIHPETLAGLYGFTLAEARLVIALVSGQTLEAVSAATGSSPNTLKNHLKAVFRKTGATRQAELMKLVLSGPAIFRRSAP